MMMSSGARDKEDSAYKAERTRLINDGSLWSSILDGDGVALSRLGQGGFGVVSEVFASGLAHEPIARGTDQV